jgi:hypothetical protein
MYEAHPAPPKKCRVQKSGGKFSPRFFGIKNASSSLIIFQRTKLATRRITRLSWCNWRTFRRKNTASSLRVFLHSCLTMPLLTGHLQPRRNWHIPFPISWSPALFSGSGLVGLPPFSVVKNNCKVAIFYPTCWWLLPRRTGWAVNFWFFFLNVLHKLEQRAKKCIELRGEYVE